MAPSTGKPAEGNGSGRAAKRSPSTARATKAVAGGSEAAPGSTPDPAAEPRPAAETRAAAETRGDPGRVRGMEALAGHRVPRNAPGPAPIPTTRRGMLRYRVLPRSVVGISVLILAFAIGAGFSGVVLYSYYQYKQNQADNKVNALVNGYKGEFAKAQSDLNNAVAAAKADVANQLKAAQALQVGPAQLAALTKQMAPSVFFVHTLDANGQPAVGSAFVISSSGGQSLLLTSYTTVAAATHSPAPPVYVRQGSTDSPVTVRSWDPQYDLALLVMSKGGLPPLTPAPTSPSPQPGDRLFAVSGLGTAGASLTQGFVVDASSSGVTVDTAIGTSFQGGPVVNQKGQVVAVGSRTYAPLGFSSTGVYYVPYVEAACNKVLSCPGGALTG